MSTTGVVAINDPEWPSALLVDERQLEEIINHLNSSNDMTNAVKSYEYIKNNSLDIIDLQDEETKSNFQVMSYNDLLITEDDRYKAYSCCFRCSLGFIDYSDQPDQGFKHVAVYQDDQTKFTILKPLKEKNGSDVLRCLMDIFSMIGVPAKIYTPEKSLVQSLMSKDIGSFCQDFSTKIKLPKSRHFEETECRRIDKAIKNWMKCMESAEWSFGLYLVQFQNNICYNNVIQAAPFSVLLRPNYTYSKKKYTRYLVRTRDKERTTEQLCGNLIDSLESSNEQCLRTENSKNKQKNKNAEFGDDDGQENENILLEDTSEKGSENEMKEKKLLEHQSELVTESKTLIENEPKQEKSNMELLKDESEKKGEKKKLHKEMEEKRKLDTTKNGNKPLENGIEKSNRELLESESETSRKDKKMVETKSGVEKSKSKVLESDSKTERKTKELLKTPKTIKNVEESEKNVKLAEDIVRLKKVDVEKTFPLKFEILKLQNKKSKMYLKVVPENTNDLTDWYECAIKCESSHGKSIGDTIGTKKSHKSTSGQNEQTFCLICKKKKRLKTCFKADEKLEVGSTVRVRVPVMERKRGYPNFILGVIVQETLTGMYRVATPFGILKESFKKNQLTPCNHKILMPDDIMNLQEIKTCKALTFSLDGNLIRCTCQRNLGFCNPRFTYHSKCHR